MDKDQRTDVVKDVRIFQVLPDWEKFEVRISFYGGPKNACGTVLYCYSSAVDVALAYNTADAWRCAEASLTVSEIDGITSIRPLPPTAAQEQQ